MNRIIFIFFALSVLVLPSKVLAAPGSCFCGADLAGVTTEMIKSDSNNKITSNCSQVGGSELCLAKSINGQKCQFFINDLANAECLKAKQFWEKSKTGIQEASGMIQGYTGATISKFIPNCVLADPSKDKSADIACRDVAIFVFFLINVARYLFGIVGALALVMFIYGGFTLILSQGSSEKVKKGTEILTAAVIGLVIMFGAYMLVQFLGEAVNIKSDFKLN